MRKNVKGPYVTVGVQGTEATKPRKPKPGEEDVERAFGSTNIELALVHEFGSRDGRVPQRSFIRASVDRERKMLNEMLKDTVVAIAAGSNARIAIGLVGAKARAEMVRTIDNSIGLKPLKRRTIMAKGSTRPLIDTAQLKQALTWKAYNV